MLRLVGFAAFTVVGLISLALLAAVLLVMTGSAKPYAIPSSAMEPTLHCATPAPGCQADTKDRVYALTRFVSYERGDIVVFDATEQAAAKCGNPGKFVKRIVGLPGERLELRFVDGRELVYIDGEELVEPYVQQQQAPRRASRAYSIPVDAYFVMGDNRPLSCDSREWGVLPADNLTGKVVATYWPPGRWTIR
jgi:signal peptidase I